MGNATVVEMHKKLEFPPHWGNIWLDGDLIYLAFRPIENINPPLRMVAHVVSFPADEEGITAVEGILNIRRHMMQKGNEALLLKFAEVGADPSAIVRLYNNILAAPAD